LYRKYVFSTLLVSFFNCISSTGNHKERRRRAVEYAKLVLPEALTIAIGGTSARVGNVVTICAKVLISEYTERLLYVAPRGSTTEAPQKRSRFGPYINPPG
jgi:hypothetical protein